MFMFFFYNLSAGVFKAYSELTYAERLYDTVQTVHGISDDIIHCTGTIVTLDKFGHQLEKLKYVTRKINEGFSK